MQAQVSSMTQTLACTYTGVPAWFSEAVDRDPARGGPASRARRPLRDRAGSACGDQAVLSPG